MARYLAATVLVLCAAVSAVAQDDGPLSSSLSPTQTHLFDRVTNAVLAPCCWREPASVHQSPAAVRVREEVTRMVRGGYGEQEILDKLAAEYGERILREPRGRVRVVVYTVPALVLCAAIIGLLMFIRRSRNRPDAPAGLVALPDLPDLDV